MSVRLKGVPRRQFIGVRVADLAVLVDCLKEVMRHPDIGHLDAERSYNQLLRHLNREIMLDHTAIVSVLASAKCLDDKGAFRHADYATFDEFAHHVIGKYGKFSKSYSHFTWKEKDGSLAEDYAKDEQEDP